MQEIKDKVASEKHGKNWDDLLYTMNGDEYLYDAINRLDIEQLMDEVCILAQKQALYNAAESGKIRIIDTTRGLEAIVSKESITNESNFVI